MNSLPQLKRIIEVEDRRSLIIISFISVSNIIFTYLRITAVAQMLTLLFVLYATYRKKENLLPIIVFSISNSGSLSIFTVSASICICTVYVIKNIINGVSVCVNTFFIMLFFMIYSFQYYIRYEDIQSAFVFPFKIVIVVLFFLLYTSDMSVDKNNGIFLYKTIVYGIVGILVNVFASMALLGENRFRVVNNDSNILAVMAAAFLAMACVLFLRHNIGGVGYFAFIVVSSFAIILLAGSRNGLLLLAIIFLLTILFNFTEVSKMTFLIFVLMIAGVLVLSSSAGRAAIDTYLFRTQVLEANGDISNGRYEIWEEYFNAFNSSPENWWLGFGAYKNAGITEMAHNGIIEDICSNGLIGYFMILLSYGTIVKQHRRIHQTTKGKFYHLLPIIVLFVSSLTLRGFTNIVMLIPLYLGMILYYLPQTSTEAKGRII